MKRKIFDIISRAMSLPYWYSWSDSMSRAKFTDSGLMHITIRQRLNSDEITKFDLFHFGPRYFRKVINKNKRPTMIPNILRFDISYIHILYFEMLECLTLIQKPCQFCLNTPWGSPSFS